MVATKKKSPASSPEPESTAVAITAPKFETVRFAIVGTAPLVQHRFSAKQRHAIMETQAAGQQARSKKKREAKDFDEVFRAAAHISEDGWYGIPAPSFRSAMIDACRLVGYKMTIAKQSLFVVADGLDADEGTPLVRLDDGDPERHEAMVRNATGVCDVRVRPMWRRWSLTLRIQFDADQFSHEDVTNLVYRAGMQVGVGEGRPFSKKSHGQGWGTFTISEE